MRKEVNRNSQKLCPWFDSEGSEQEFTKAVSLSRNDENSTNVTSLLEDPEINMIHQ